MCRRSLSSPSARTVRDTALAALGAAAVTRTGAPTKQLDLDAERATRFCDWIGRVATGSEGQRTVADEHGRETRAGVPASRKPYDLKFPVSPVASRSMGAAPETRACAMLARARVSPARRRR